MRQATKIPKISKISGEVMLVLCVKRQRFLRFLRSRGEGGLVCASSVSPTAPGTVRGTARPGKQPGGGPRGEQTFPSTSHLSPFSQIESAAEQKQPSEESATRRGSVGQAGGMEAQ